MQKLVDGIHHFQNSVFTDKENLFRQLADGQKPAALVMTCSDSRVLPHLVMDADPGDIFVLRNAGNLIPAAPELSGELATIEFALVELGIQDIVICGHSNCGAMKGLLARGQIGNTMPFVKDWLRHAKRTSEITQEKYSHLCGAPLLTATVEENVLVQIENLRSHSLVRTRLAQGALRLHGWVYNFETGEVFSYDPTEGQFVALKEAVEPPPVYPRPAVTKHQTCVVREGGDL